MDTSKIYIKMCNCPEIQTLWKLEEGQVYYVDPMLEIFSWASHSDGAQSNGYIWSDCFERIGRIPSKKDLQKFIKIGGKNCPKWCDDMYPCDKLQAEYVKDWKYGEIRTLAPFHLRIYKTWDIIHKIRKKEFYAYGINFRGNIKVLIDNINYFYIWLPRQDELQKMLDYNLSTLTEKFWNFYNTIRFEKDYLNQFISMEQLWLIFIMQKLHKLKWNGKKWIPN